MVTIRLIAHYNTCFHRSHKTIRAKLFPHSAQCIILKSLVMKRFSKLMILAIAISSGMMSCSTNAVEDEPTPINPESETRTLNIRVVSNDFTRADESGNEINTLYLAFYKGEETTPLYIKPATLGQNNTYSVEIPANMTKLLDKVIAFANITDKDIISGALTGSTVEKVQNDDDYLIMSSAVYFDNNATNTSKPIYSSPITYNETDRDKTIYIYLERVAAKIAVNNDNYASSELPVTNYEGSSINLSTDIVGWGLTFTDSKSYLMKQLPNKYNATTFENLESQLESLTNEFYAHSDWNNHDNRTISWANSVNCNAFSESNLNIIKLSEANKEFGPFVYAHESTRSKTTLQNKNSKPSIVIVGQYKNGNTLLGTFYRLRSNGKDYIYTAEEYFDYLSKEIDFIYVKENDNITKASAENLNKLLTLSTPSENIAGSAIPDFYVTPQVKVLEDNGNQTIVLCKKSGDQYSIDELNKLLYAHAGLLEMYYNGQCIFIEPIKHFHKDGNDIYGIIRNHSYKLNIYSITGFGRGVASNKSLISEEDIPEISSSYKVNTTVYVNEWNEQPEQDIDIDTRNNNFL